MSENEGLCFLPVSVLPVVNCSAEDVVAGDIFRGFYVFVFLHVSFKFTPKFLSTPDNQQTFRAEMTSSLWIINE